MKMVIINMQEEHGGVFVIEMLSEDRVKDLLFKLEMLGFEQEYD